MDEEKQKNGLMKKTGDALKKGAKDQAKKLMQKVFKKIIMAIVPILLKFLVIVLIAAIIVTAISNLLDLLTGKSSKDADALAVDYSSHITEESSNNRIIVDANNISENGAYKLDYEFKDEDENVLTEDEAIKKIKEDLLEENNKLDLSKFSDPELKIIGALMYNGLKVDKYTEEELKALTIFVKADIAGQSFDLRKADEIGEKITLDDVRDSDEVFGTLQVHRTKVEIDKNGNINYTPVKLEYIEYGDENTPGTFCYMVAQKDLDVINKFSTDEDGNLVIAKWSKTIETYTYESEDIEKIPEENIKENVNEIDIIKSKPIEYKQYISEYIASYGLLSDLLVVTQNVEFCKELAELVFNSKIVINVKEELTTTHSETTTNYTQTTLLYDYVKYELYGQKEITTKNWEKVISGAGAPSDNESLTKTYGWDSSMEPVSVTGNSSGGTVIYEWTYNNVNYRLQNTSTLTYSNWILYKEAEKTTYEDLPKETNLEQEGDLINLNNNHIKKEYEDYTIDEDYTDSEILKYTEIAIKDYESNAYNIEISEVDTWNFKYNKEYENPTMKPKPSSFTSNIPGEYSEELIQVLNTTDPNEINADNHVIGFIAQRKGEYKNTYPEAKDIQCDVNELTVKQRVKIDSYTECTSLTESYKFGEAIADTTEIKLKNVEYINNEPSFTKEDEDGNPEIGFLYIYDSYRTSGVDLYLENDAEKQLFELLELDTKTIGASDIIKGLLYVYDGIDRGVTEFDLSIFKPREMKNATLSSSVLLKKYIHFWEHSTEPPTNADGTCYIIEDDGVGNPTVGYGVDIFNSGYSYLFKQNGYPTEIGGEVPIEFVDGIEDMIIENTRQLIEAEVSGLNLTGYQINALISRAYNCGVYGAVNQIRGDSAKNFVDSYLAYWNQEEDDQYKDKNNIATFENDLYKQYMSKPVTANGRFLKGLENRRKSEWTLFQTGYYDVLDTWHTNIDSLLDAAMEVHDAQMNWSYSLGGLPSKDIEASLNNPNRVTCCATYVASVIYVSGYLTEEQINSFDNYNYVPTLYEDLRELGWEEIYSYDELEPGDIVVTQNNGRFAHIQIYAGDDTWYNAGSNNAIQSPAPQNQGSWGRTWFQVALRPSN